MIERYGRPEPDYTHSDLSTVVVRLSNAAADKAFLRMILEAEKRRSMPMSLDALIVLGRLRKERRLGINDLASAIQKDESSARSVIEKLTEAGLVEAHGIKKGRTYTLSAKVYRDMGEQTNYVRQAGFDIIQLEQMVLQYVRKHDHIKRKDVIELCKIGPFQATRLLKRIAKSGEIAQYGKGRGAYYGSTKRKK